MTLAKAEAPPAAFAGFSPAGLRFLSGLAKHNERDWFNARKDVYRTEVEAPLKALAGAVAAALDRAGIPLAPRARSPVFRIYRDVRFSPDKRPYKTHAAFALHRFGDPAAHGVAYVHVDPKEPFLAAGFYGPPPDALRALRAAVAAEPKPFVRLAAKLAAADAGLSDDVESLVRPPAGFRDADPAVEAYLRRKSFIARRALAPAQLQDAGLVDEIVAFVRAARPLLVWGWAALDA